MTTQGASGLRAITNSVIIGGGAGGTVTGNDNTVIGAAANAAATITNATALGNGVTVGATNTMVFGNGAVVGWGFGVNPGAANAIQVGTNGANGNGAVCTVGGAWVNGSSREFKDDFQPLNSDEILSKIKTLNVSRWKYKGTSEYHIGPIAEEFYAAFKTGNDDKHISTIDPSGVSLLAIQELMKKIEVLEKEIEALKAKVK